MLRKKTTRPNGIILLVVLSMLTFFSLLVAAYLVFSSQSLQSSFAISTRTIKSTNNSAILNDALMMLVRGTNDPNHPFFGEDLLSDYYGRTDSLQSTLTTAAALVGPAGSGIHEVRLAPGAGTPDRNDVFSGRIVSFVLDENPTVSTRVLRSVSYGGGTHGLICELPSGVASTEFAVGIPVVLNGVPRSSPGIGFSTGSNLIDQVSPNQPVPPLTGADGTAGFPGLPVALQPNHLGRLVDKSTTTGDFDESYDAADFNNWFLSYRHNDGKVIPSFHRPAVVNYLLNQVSDWSSDVDVRNAYVSLARSTFRPLPIAKGQLSASSLDFVRRGFTGGNENYALRIGSSPVVNAARLDQLAKVLTGQVDNPWDVDNDGDGVNDSIWIDIGLPVIIAPDGRLLRPLVAPMIEDLSARINVNAHDNSFTSAFEINAALTSNMFDDDGDGEIDNADEQNRLFLGGHRSPNGGWAGTRQPAGNASNRVEMFKGFGYGPAEIRMPSVLSPVTASIVDRTIAARDTVRPLLNLVQVSRYQNGVLDVASAPSVPGSHQAELDGLDTLLTGRRNSVHSPSAGTGYPQDVFGRGGLGIGRAGQLILSDAGASIATPAAVNEAVNDPYESDPTGFLAGDNPVNFNEMETLFRGFDFDRDLLPDRLRANKSSASQLARALTNFSRSDDTPTPMNLSASGGSFYTTLVTFLAASGVPASQIDSLDALIPPEIRLGRKLDVNRFVGNGFDDNSNLVIDEPAEVAAETEAFRVNALTGEAIPSGFAGVAPSYSFGSSVTGRQLLARHLYLLASFVTRTSAFPTVSTTIDPGLYKARRLAQWAVNVVDYSDPDSIMTRFDYDPSPFDADGWNPTQHVFGAEAPELMLSEAFGFHDVRVKDSPHDNSEGERKNGAASPEDNDRDTDQVRIPQGSVFVELFCPRAPVDSLNAADSTSNAGIPAELYSNVATATPSLDLSRQAPSPGGGVPGAPVWRLAFSEPHHGPGMGYPAHPEVAKDPLTIRTSHPDSASFHSGNLDELDPGVGSITLERFVWFSSFSSAADVGQIITGNGIGDMTPANVFFAPAALNPSLQLRPGQYLSIAPRTDTALGSYTAGGAVPERPSQQRFTVTAGDGVVHNATDGARRTPLLNTTASYMPALPLVIGTFPPTGWNAGVFQGGFVGLNVSEPLPLSASYYPEPTQRYLGTAGPGLNYPLIDAYVDLSAPANTAIDTPLDIAVARIPQSTSPSASSFDDGMGTAGTLPEPALGTIPRYCSIYLQRLADPLTAFDATSNPYVTVDWMSLDLTVFSGEERESQIAIAGDYTRRTRQRNGFVAGNRTNALFSYETDFEDPSVGLDNVGGDYFAFSTIGGGASLESSFNFLNTADPTSNPGFNGYYPSLGSEGAITTDYERNFPRIPFAQHPWLNRPFVTPYELMMVPASSPSRMFDEFSVSTSLPILNATAGMPVTISAPQHGLQTADIVFISGVEGLSGINGQHQVTVNDSNTFTLDGSNSSGTYVTNSGVVSIPRVEYSGVTLPPASQILINDLHNWHSSFRHLLNFFHAPTTAANAVPLWDLLSIASTKPPFRGEAEAIAPSRVSSGDLAVLFRAPHNFTYSNTRIAQINLNTIADPNVWRGLMHNHMVQDEYTTLSGASGANLLAYDTFVTQRRGYALNETDRPVTGPGPYNYIPTKATSRFPTEFAGVFRDPTRAAMMPQLRNADASSYWSGNRSRSGLVRDKAIYDGVSPARDTGVDGGKLFVRNAGQQPQSLRFTDWPALGVIQPSQNFHADRNQNAFMRYQTLLRMPNLVSDNSQTFLVRLTLGFFETSASDLDDLGAEHGESTGQVQRYKAMFIIDRSIPVGFVPGRDLNARDTVVFERFYQ